MTRQITIDPVTRIEGHARITIQLDELGYVSDARFHVDQFRGFEKLCEGRPFAEMPSLMARICGICPVSHLIASSKACDAIMGVGIPETAQKLRRVLNLAQIVQSHALSFFHLSSPDLLLGFDADPARRSLFGVIAERPDVARDGVRLRQFGQQIIEWLAGKRLHPAWVVAGGVSEPLKEETRDRILATTAEALEIVERTAAWFEASLERFSEEIATFANFPTMFLGLVDTDGGLEHYDGRIRVTDSAGNVIADDLDPAKYDEYIAEAVEPDSYLKSPYYKPLGHPWGIYRVGPLARLNIVDRCGTPKADAMLEAIRGDDWRPATSSFHYHRSRLVEMCFAIERIEELLGDPAILDRRVRAFADSNNLEGVGVSEAPRGTLMHHYRVDENGLIVWANLVIATGHNSLAMNRGVLQVAKHFVQGEKIEEGLLNRVEAVIRAYDPCLSCATHALGRMPLRVRLVDASGALVDEVARE